MYRGIPKRAAIYGLKDLKEPSQYGIRLLSRYCASVGLASCRRRRRRLGRCLSDHIGLMHGTLNNLLLFRIEVLGKILVEGRLLLLESCVRAVSKGNCLQVKSGGVIRSRACLNML